MPVGADRGPVRGGRVSGPGGRGDWWARRARAVLAGDARAQTDGVGLLPRRRLRVALRAVLELEPANVLRPDVDANEPAGRVALETAGSVLGAVRTLIGQALTAAPGVGGAEGGVGGPERPGDGGGQDAGRTGRPGGFTVAHGLGLAAGGDGARVPTVSIGTRAAYLLLDHAGIVLGHSTGWTRAHDLAHAYTDGPPVDLPVRVVGTATLAEWWVWGPDGCYRPDPVTGMPAADFTCPRTAVDRPAGRPSRRFFGRAGFLTVPFLGLTGADPRTVGEEIATQIGDGRALLAEIERKIVLLTGAAGATDPLRIAGIRSALTAIADGLADAVTALESAARDTSP